MTKVAVKGTVSVDIAEELREVCRRRKVSVSAILERALDVYLRDLQERDRRITSEEPARR